MAKLTSGRTVQLEKCGDDWDWYALHGGGNWASVEGDAAEWSALAVALRAGENVRFKRLACERAMGGWNLYSPRNACGPNDTLFLPADQALDLAAEIERCVLAAERS